MGNVFAIYLGKISALSKSKNRYGLRNELLRKSIHLLIAIVPSIASIDLRLAVLLLVYGLSIYTLCETLRMQGYKVPFISFITERAARERDEGKFILGPITLGLGALLSLIFYPAPAASIAIYTLAFGDGIASLVGRHLGHLRPRFLNGKSIEGSIACFSAVWLIMALSGYSFTAGLLVAGAVSLVEALPLKDYDNLTIPLAAGAFVQLIRITGI